MEKEQPKWKRISKGEKLPCWAFLMMMDGTITNVTAMGVTIKQDAYYLPSYGLIETIKDFPKEESEDEKIRKAMIEYFTNGREYLSLTPYGREDYISWLEKQGEHKPTNWLQELEDKLANDTPQQLAEWKEKYFKEEPTEWSEEDECNVINICAHLRSVLTNETVEKYRNWFEIIRQKLSNVERNGKNWKPSKEQIRVVARLRHCLLEDVRGNDVVILDNLLEQLKEL